jgi:hypothetical protein
MTGCPVRSAPFGERRPLTLRRATRVDADVEQELREGAV